MVYKEKITDVEQLAQQGLSALDGRHLRRMLKETARDGVEVEQEGKHYISFACNDYLGLSHHPEVMEAGKRALEAYGAGAGASRLITGNHPMYAPLEHKIAAMKGAESALVFGSGYLANVGTIPAFVGKGDLILADKLAHACILDGAKLSGATLKRFKHNDVAHAEALLAERGKYKNVLIITEHVFSMDGDVAPLRELSKLAKTHSAWLMVDDAHGLGMLKNDAEVDIWMGTLSKSAGSYGGYIASSKVIVDYVLNHARSVIFSTGLPPADCAASLKALEIMQREPQRGQRAIELAQRVTAALGMAPAQSAIVPIIKGTEKKALDAAEKLKAQGLLAVAIRPPTVPPGTSRIRLTFSAAHTDAQVTQLIEALRS